MHVLGVRTGEDLVNSGISTAASVPQLMIEASSHHRLGIATPLTAMSLINSLLMPNEYDAERRSNPDQPGQRLLRIKLFQPPVLSFGNELVDQVRQAGHEVHQEPHGKKSHDQFGLQVDLLRVATQSDGVPSGRVAFASRALVQ